MATSPQSLPLPEQPATTTAKDGAEDPRVLLARLRELRKRKLEQFDTRSEAIAQLSKGRDDLRRELFDIETKILELLFDRVTQGVADQGKQNLPSYIFIDETAAAASSRK